MTRESKTRISEVLTFCDCDGKGLEIVEEARALLSAVGKEMT